MGTAFSSGRSFLLAGVIAIGLSAVWFVVSAFLISATERSAIRNSYEYLVIRVDGEPVILKQSQLGLQQHLLTLDRKPAAGNAFEVLHPNPVPVPQEEELTPSSDWTLRLASVSDGGTPANYWYLVHDGQPNGHAYGVGYNSVSKRVVGYIGKTGFAETLPPREEWFQVSGNAALSYGTAERTFREPYWYFQPSLYLIANGKLWDINTRAKSVKYLLDCPDALGIGWAWKTADELPQPRDGEVSRASESTPRVLALRTAEACVLVDPRTGDATRYPLPSQLQAEAFSVAKLSDGRLLIISPWRTPEQNVTWLDESGKAVAEKRVALDATGQQMNDSSITVASALVAPAPIWQACMLGIFLQLPNPATAEGVHISALGKAVAIGWPGFVLHLVLSLVLAWVAWRRQQQYRLPVGWAWALFVALFGLLGWLAYRWHRNWPPLEDCPNCDHLSPRDRARCTECGTEFPPPKLTGVEVFA